MQDERAIPDIWTRHEAYRTSCITCRGAEDVRVTNYRTVIDAMTAHSTSIALCRSCRHLAIRSMSDETTESIAQWQNETFGPATTTLDRIKRSDESMMGAMWRAKHCDLSQPRPNLSRAIRAAEELAELIDMLVARDDDPEAVEEVADVQIVLEGIPSSHGQESSDAKDAKMRINRARRWTTAGDGHGQHVKDEQ